MSADKQPRQHRQHHSVGRFEIGPGHLSAQHRHLMAEHQDLHILGPTVPGELGQHLKDLPQQQVDQRRAYGLHRVGYGGRTCTEPHVNGRNPILEPHTLAAGLERKHPGAAASLREALHARHALGDADGIRALLRAITKALGDLDAEPDAATVGLAAQLRTSLETR